MNTLGTSGPAPTAGTQVNPMVHLPRGPLTDEVMMAAGGGWGGGAPGGAPPPGGGGFGSGQGAPPPPGGGWGPGGGAPPGGAPPGGYGGPSPGYAPPGGGALDYEFNDAENKTISNVAMWAKALGIVGFVTGGLNLVQLNIIGGLVEVGIGFLFFTAGKRFSAVVDTQGNDIQHMMEALGKLSEAFTIKLVLVGIAIALMLCAAIVVAMVGASALG